VYEQEEMISSLSIFPNPCRDILFVQNQTGKLSERGELQSVSINSQQLILYDVLGREVERSTGKTSIATGHLSAGVYFLRVISVNGTEFRKVLKQ
jgi:hypothetical protein